MARWAPRREQWFHSQMIDWMMANPGGKLQDLAAFIQRSPNTVSMIVNSDMFKAALAERKSQYATMQDLSLIKKTTEVAHASLDALLGVLEKKKDKIPIGTLNEISGSALSRLGYGTQPQPGVQVNINNSSTHQVVVPVSGKDLEDARMMLRAVQESKARGIPPPVIDAVPTIDDLIASPGAEPVSEEDVDSAPATLSS